MTRQRQLLYLLGAHVAVGSSVLLLELEPEAPATVATRSAPALTPEVPRLGSPTGEGCVELPLGDQQARDWFCSVKPHCNETEIDAALLSSAAPPTPDGSGYKAACLALAGRLDDARAELDATGQPHLANLVFNVVHPVSHVIEKAAGPGMHLVIEYMPNHPPALYHAGMADYELENYDEAESLLVRFLELYKPNDTRRRAAKQTIEAIRSR